MPNQYSRLIIAGSFSVGDGYRAVNSELVNEVATLWAYIERNIDAREGTNSGADVHPL